MNEPEREPGIRRIMVALDASVHSLAALEAAAELAAALEAELIGVFVEDVNLLRLAGLPFAREFGQWPPLMRPLDPASMERQLRLQAQRLRQALARAATQRRLKWSFRTVRGQVAAELLTAAQEVDLLALGKASWSVRQQVRLGSTARTVVAQASRTVLILQHGAAICPPIQVVYDGSAAGQRALTIAASLAAATAGPVTVIVLADTAEAAARLEAEAAERLRGWGAGVDYRRLLKPAAEELAQIIRSSGGGTLVISAGHPILEGEGLSTVLEAVQCSALLVR
jgi:nucleotide-binding universal stress UspA family protein